MTGGSGVNLFTDIELTHLNMLKDAHIAHETNCEFKFSAEVKAGCCRSDILGVKNTMPVNITLICSKHYCRHGLVV